MDSIVVADDVPLLFSPSSGSDSDVKARTSKVGARGLGANILTCKLIGGAAERGLPCLSSKHLEIQPTRTTQTWVEGVMGSEEYGIGLGLHNEPGAYREALRCPGEVVEEMLQLILEAENDSWKLVGKEEEELCSAHQEPWRDVSA